MSLSAGDIEVLFDRDRPRVPAVDLPAPLTALYAGRIAFRRPCLFANFVASVDGVVALPIAGESGHVVSGGSEADAFVMALLRACADAVLVGAGTFRKAAGHLWEAAGMYPSGAPLFSEMRARLGLRSRPTLVVVTGSGKVDTKDPALREAVLLTTPAGAAEMSGRAPPGAEVIGCLGEAGTAPWVGAIERLHARGLSVVLCEGGPSLFGELAAAGVMDELFVTSSPALYGRAVDDRRKSLVEGIDLGGVGLDLVSVRRYRSHLFLRYAFAGRGA